MLRDKWAEGYFFPIRSLQLGDLIRCAFNVQCVKNRYAIWNFPSVSDISYFLFRRLWEFMLQAFCIYFLSCVRAGQERARKARETVHINNVVEKAGTQKKWEEWEPERERKS